MVIHFNDVAKIRNMVSTICLNRTGGKAEGSLVTKCLLKKYLSVIVKREITKLKVLLNMLCKTKRNVLQKKQSI